MVVDGMTKWASQVARDTTMSFAKPSTWRVVQDSKFTAAKRRKTVARLADMEEDVDRTAVFVPSYQEDEDECYDEDYAVYAYYVGLLSMRMTQDYRTIVI